MAVSFVPQPPIGVRACATGGHRKPDAQRRKTSSPNWWTPLFGWSSEPDYIDSGYNRKADLSAKVESDSGSNPEPKTARSRFRPGCFTEEKARQLRMMTTDASSFHDAMYHSAIASRLASDFSCPSDK
ncbi:hypothetical protein U1Q18_028472 [Sarracenia purpurea var. burkii]